MKKILPFLFFLSLIFPASVMAQNGLVPCEGPDCELCDLFTLFANLVEFALITLVPPVAAILFMYGGVMFFFNMGDPSKVEKGKKIIISTLIGIVIVYGAHCRVSMFLSALDVGEVQWPNIDFC